MHIQVHKSGLLPAEPEESEDMEADAPAEPVELAETLQERLIAG